MSAPKMKRSTTIVFDQLPVTMAVFTRAIVDVGASPTALISFTPIMGGDQRDPYPTGLTITIKEGCA